MAWARCTASPRLCAPSFRYGRDGSEQPLPERIGNEEVPSALNRLGPAGPTVSEYSSLATEIPASVVMFGGVAVIAPRSFRSRRQRLWRCSCAPRPTGG
jgi:hypothetical protein